MSPWDTTDIKSHLTHRYRERYSTSRAVRDTRIKTTASCPLTPAGRAVLRKTRGDKQRPGSGEKGARAPYVFEKSRQYNTDETHDRSTRAEKASNGDGRVSSYFAPEALRPVPKSFPYSRFIPE